MSAQPDPSVSSAIRVVGGNPTPEEVAAASAVLQAALDELAGMRRRAVRTPTRWERERRGLRTPLERGGWTRWAR
ncbi:MAG TPA: acyl-CoA carboxylase epsilon subunit [Protaetiibacter sp.]|nr:acyl-CoA carboxylase epsilon subunit [Protaetiibacter sp.]